MSGRRLRSAVTVLAQWRARNRGFAKSVWSRKFLPKSFVNPREIRGLSPLVAEGKRGLSSVGQNRRYGCDRNSRSVADDFQDAVVAAVGDVEGAVGVDVDAVGLVEVASIWGAAEAGGAFFAGTSPRPRPHA